MKYNRHNKKREGRGKVYTNGYREVEVTPQQGQAYKALYRAAERMGINNYMNQREKWLKEHKNMKNFKFTVTPEQREIVEAMPKVLNGKITPDVAMSLLWQYETMNQRLG